MRMLLSVVVSLVLISLVSQQSLHAAEWSVGYRGEDDSRYDDYNITNAAKILSGYMTKVLGRDVPAAPLEKVAAEGPLIVLTDSSHAPKEIADQFEGLPGDAFTIRYPVQYEGREVCLLVSNDRWAYDYVAYYFLTTFMDVHWVGPGELGEVYDVQPDWQMPASINVFEVPDFEHRFWHMKSFSGRQWLGRSMRMSWHHNLGNIFDPAKHAETSPEVYPTLMDGTKYIPTEKHGWQPCLTHPKSIEIATKFVLNSLKSDASRRTASLSLNDGAGNNCFCETCKAMDPPGSYQPGKRPVLSDRFYNFCNKVVEKARETNPHAMVAAVIYGVAGQPPKYVKVNPNVKLFHVQPTVQSLAQWSVAGAASNLHLWLYDAGYLSIRPDMRMITQQLRMAHATGGIGVYSENIAMWQGAGPKFYVFAHQLWDVDRTVEELYTEYFTYAYGSDAGPHVQRYYSIWDEVFNRQSLFLRTQTIRTWRRSSQFEFLERRDVVAMDKALQKAAAANMNDKQRARFGYMQTYANWLRINAEQVLLARELADPGFRESKSLDELIEVIEPSLSLTDQFNAIWDEHISKDETGWLVDWNLKRKIDRTWDLFYAQVRMLVDSEHDVAIDGAIAFAADRLVKEQGEEKAIAMLRDTIKKHPKMTDYIGPQIALAQGKTPVNVVPNGDFENSTPAPEGSDPMKVHPKVDGWLTYQQFGKMKSTQNEYKLGEGHDGKTAIGTGAGDYGELRTGLALEEGARYRITFWYKTENRNANCNLWIFSYDGPLTELIEMDNQKQLARFLRFELQPTDGEWQRFTTTFRASTGGNFIMQPAAGRQAPGTWTWFDDIEIVKLWPQ